MTTRCLAVTGGDSIGKCGSQPSWLLVRTIIYGTHTYLLTYLLAARGNTEFGTCV